MNLFLCWFPTTDDCLLLHENVLKMLSARDVGRYTLSYVTQYSAGSESCYEQKHRRVRYKLSCVAVWPSVIRLQQINDDNFKVFDYFHRINDCESVVRKLQPSLFHSILVEE